MTPGTAAWMLSFQLSPIILCNGIAQNLPVGVLPIISITEAASFLQGVFGGGGPASLDDYFANFTPLPGGTLAENQLGAYPFANQTVAGNAIIAQPKVISMLMICPAKRNYLITLATMMALTSALDQHDAAGGTYTIITPKAFYTNCIRTRMADVSNAATHQAQNAYQIDFIQPLLTLQAAQAAQNSLMSKLSNGVQINGPPSYSGAAASVGQPASLAGAPIPAGAATIGINTAPLPVPPIPPTVIET